jgi:hypothetical protein
MLYINKITNDASQQLILTGIPGIQITTTLQFMPRIQQWILGVYDGTNSIQGISVVNSLNMLRQWKNVLIYGISCVSTDGLDPYQISDFANQRCSLFLLNSTDVAEIESGWFP